jgi:hypothetical protein
MRLAWLSAGTPGKPEDPLQHRLVSDERDDTLRRCAWLELAIPREHFAVRIDDQLAYGQLVGAGICFVAAYTKRNRAGVRAVLPDLRIPPLPCWPAMHREVLRLPG